MTERVLFFAGPWKLFISQTRPRPLPRVTGPSSVSVSPRFRLQLGLLVHLGRRFDAPERDGMTGERGERERGSEEGKKGKRGRKRNPARDRKKRETRPIRAKLI